MKRHLLAALGALALGLSAATALGGCGSQTKTVTVANAPATTHSTATTASTPASTATTHTSTTTAPTSTAGGAAAPNTTRTAPEPAFAQPETHAAGASEAESVLKARGYTPNETSQYHSNQTLRVLVGTHTGSSDGYNQQAFFFVGARFIGTDTKEPSATVNVIAQSDTEITLSYPLYRKNDPLSSPSSHATVRFQLNDGKLTALDAIPPAGSANGLSRN